MSSIYHLALVSAIFGVATSRALYCENFATGTIESSVSKCSALQTATIATAEYCSAEINVINQKCNSDDSTPTCSCFAASKLSFCQSLFEIKSLMNHDCAHVGQFLQVNQNSKTSVSVEETCKSELKLIRATKDACDRTPESDEPSPVSSKICEILPDSTQAHKLSCDDLAAYLMFVRTDNKMYAKENCFSKVHALRSARSACASKLTLREASSSSSTPAVTSTLINTKKLTSKIITAQQPTCKDFTPSGEFSVAKCTALHAATIATAEYCRKDINVLNEECQSGGNTGVCACFGGSQLFICQSFFEIKSLRTDNCALLDQTLLRTTSRIRKLCKSELNLIQAAKVACDQTPESDDSLPVSSKICEILPDSTQVHELSCDDVAAYMIFLKRDETRTARKNCLPKVSALWSARATCAAKFTSGDAKMSTTTVATTGLLRRGSTSGTDLVVQTSSTHTTGGTTETKTSIATDTSSVRELARNFNMTIILAVVILPSAILAGTIICVSVIFLFALCHNKAKGEEEEEEDDAPVQKELEDNSSGQYPDDDDVKVHDQDGSDSSSVSSDSANSDNNGGFEYI